MDGSQVARLNRITDLSEVYEALDSCMELERALSRLARARIFDDEEFGSSRSQLRRICARVEGHIAIDT
jgi:hypothetical protein